MTIPLSKQGLRRCTNCRSILKLNTENFHRNKTMSSGFSYECKKCANTASKKYRLENLDKFREYDRNKYHKNKHTKIRIKKEGFIEPKLLETTNPKGLIYLLECNGLYKIGHTTNKTTIIRRIVDLQTGSPYTLNVIHTHKTDDKFLEEKKLHYKFKDKHIRGERFSLTEDDLLYIKGLPCDV